MTILLSIIGSAAFREISSGLLQAYRDRQKAETDKDKRDADERIAMMEARKAVLIAEAWNGVNQWMRLFLAFPIGILFWKVFVYDKALGQWTSGRTDGLSSELWWVVNAVVVFFFLTGSLERWGKK